MALGRARFAEQALAGLRLSGVDANDVVAHPVFTSTLNSATSAEKMYLWAEAEHQALSVALRASLRREVASTLLPAPGSPAAGFLRRKLAKAVADAMAATNAVEDERARAVVAVTGGGRSCGRRSERARAQPD